ncbi:MAG TPA: glycoside hydrolase family 38 C-terminal domain-containing protein [Candidatus Acidoferrum sp.]|jgi:alpha-mannosidase|nr:glycoside hydrolase family 38 C-terminal domain-containing protein [Candidatus Acidoferrum sp.]
MKRFTWLPHGTILFLLATGLCDPKVARALDPSRDKILYAVGYSHLDDQWNWTIQDTINSFIPSSCHVNFALLTNPNYTNYTFSFEGALRYQLIKEYYPADFLTLSNYIVQGRWHVAGSMIAPSDVNIPAPEALIRHALLADNYWGQTFGRTPVDLLLPDAFGFGYALPSVAAHCGVKGFSSMRAGPGTGIPLPFQNIGRWLGPDGSSMIAVVNPGAYSQPVTDNLANDSYHYGRITNMYAASGLYLDYMYFGNSGDQGGGPSDSTVSNVCLSVQTTNGLVNVLSASSDQLYRDLSPAQVSQLPSYQGEIVAQTLGTGGYTSHGELKRYNRQCEQQGAAAECAAVIGDWLQGGGTYPQERLDKAWERFLWHDMYDDLTGVSIPSAYTFTWNDYLLSLGDLGSEETHGIGVLARGLDTTAAGVPLVVFNPLSIAREDLVEALVIFSNGVPPAVRVFAPNGSEVPSQMGLPTGNTAPVTFLADVPAMGAAIYDVRPSPAPSSLDTGLSISTSQVQNGRYLVQLSAGGDVTSILDKVNNRQLLSRPIRWDFLYDLSTSLPSWEIQYNNVVAPPTSYLSGPAQFQVLENGPARVTLGVTRYNAGSTFTERIRLGAGDAGDRVEWDVSASWNTLQTMLKMEFPLAVSNSTATFDLGMGTIQRPNETLNLYELPAQQWADLTGASGSYGVTIMNDCKYGWDKPNNNTLRLTIFHTPAVGSSFPYQANDSLGTHRMLLGIMGHPNDWRAGGSSWVAARLNQPLQAFQTLAHGPVATGFSNTFSFLSCNNSNIMVKALKKAQNGNELIVRLQELTGQAQTVQLSSVAPIIAARQVSGTENPIASLTPVNGALTVSLGGYAPMTLALTLAAPGALLPTPASSAVPLPFNLDVISTDGNRTNGNFDGGYSYPAELMPPSIVRDGITFQLGPTNDGALNALSCQGQIIPLKASGFNRLYFLAAAASNSTAATFAINGTASALTIPYFSGFIGQWKPPSVLTNQEVAWVCTHRHDGAGNNNAYNFCYLFQYGLDLPAGASSLVLPNAPNIRIFSMTLATNTTPETVPAGGRIAGNAAPWAKAGPNQTVNAATTNGPATVKLDGSGSAAPGGTIVSYLWSQNGTVLATGGKPVVTLPLGTNVILLTVADDKGQTAADATTIVVLPPLTVTLTANPTNSSGPPLTVQFTGQASGGLAGSSVDTTDDHLGTITAQGENNGINGNWEMATNAFDDNIATKWLDFANSYPATRQSWIQYQYPQGMQRVVTNYTLTSANDAPERDPANWGLLGSNDGGTTWVTLDVRTAQVFTNRFEIHGYNIAGPAAYNIYRLRIDSVANPATAVAVQLSEIQLLRPPLYDYFWSFGDGATATAVTSGPVSVQHTYTNNGTYTVVLAASFGIYTGTNTIQITVGPELAVTALASPDHGAAALSVQFTAQASGGRTNNAIIDTTEDHLGTITAQGENNGLNGNQEGAANAFDDTTGTKWLDFANNYPNTRQSWIQYQYANSVRYVVSEYTITSANDALTYPARNPANWRLLASNDGGASWDTLDVRTNQTFTADFQKLAYFIPNTNAYNLYRFQIDSVANPPQAQAVQLDELEFLAVPAYSYWWSFGDGSASTLQNPQHTYTSNGTYTVTLSVSDGQSTTTTTTVVYVAPPSLTTSLASPGQLILSWPAWAAGYALYSTPALATPSLWSPVTNVVTSTGTNFGVTLPLDVTTNRFFQLRDVRGG